MEKYTTFSDPQTGVNPFMPTWTALPKSNLLIRILKVLFLLPVYLVRLVLALVAFLLIGIAQLLLLPLSILHKGLERNVGKWLAAPGLRLLLFSLGINTIHKQRAGRWSLIIVE